MKKLPLLLSTALIGLSSNLFSQVQTTSYQENNENSLGNYGTYIGSDTGNSNTTTAKFDTFVGYYSGRNNTEGYDNAFLGAYSGVSNTVGNNNTFLGTNSGRNNIGGNANTFLGDDSGYNNTEGGYNVFNGNKSGYKNEDGNDNVFVGRRAGYNNESGSNNVFIGRYAGYNETSSNKLYIDNSTTVTPLIYGDFTKDQLTFNGQVQVGDDINTPFPTNVGGVNISDYTLFVQGGILSEEVRVTTDWADYVFKDTYKLKSLNEVENFINDNGHLPNVPSAQEVEASGIEMGKITKIQQEKIEELTLYIIAQNKSIKAQNDRIEALEAKMNNN